MRIRLFLFIMIGSLSVRAEMLTADITWTRTVDLGLDVSGVVSEVFVAEGDQVKAGQALLALDDQRMKWHLRRTRAQLEGRLPVQHEAERELARAQELYDRMVSSDYDLQQAKIAHTAADSDVTMAQTNVALAEYDLSASRLRAPFQGRVLNVYAMPGMVVNSQLQSTRLVRLADSRSLAAVVTVNARQKDKLRTRSTIDVRVNDTKLNGRLGGIVPILAQAGGRVGFRMLIIPDSPEQWEPFIGYQAVVEVSDD